MNFKSIIPILTLFLLFGCDNSSQLKSENEDLKAQIEELKLDMMHEAQKAEEAVAHARIAQNKAERAERAALQNLEEAERQKQIADQQFKIAKEQEAIAKKALENCQ